MTVQSIGAWSSVLGRPEFTLPNGFLEDFTSGRNVLITGAGGTVGTALAEVVLAGHPRQLILLDAHEASLVRLSQTLAGQRVAAVDPAYVLADVRDRAKLDQTFGRFRPDVIFHLAAYKQVPLAESNIDQVLAVNVLGTATVVESAMAHDVACIAYPSTDKAVHPFGVYGTTKRLVERYLASVADHGIATRCVRLVNVLGSQGSVAEIFARQIEAGEPVAITDPAMDRYWMTMDEATRLLVAAAARPSFEGTYLLDVGQPVPLLETARRMYRRLKPGGAEPPVRFIGVRPGERLHESLWYADEMRRETDIPGLFALESAQPPVDAGDWKRVLRDLRACLYDLDASSLRTWALAASTAAVLPDISSVTSDA